MRGEGVKGRSVPPQASVSPATTTTSTESMWNFIVHSTSGSRVDRCIGQLRYGNCATRLLVRRTANTELPHHGLQRGSLETEARCRSARTSHDTAAITERFENRLPVYLLKRAGSAPDGRSNRLRAKVLQRQLQLRSWRQDHSPLDHVLELANVAGPRPLSKRVHHIRRNRRNRTLQAFGKPVGVVPHQSRYVFGSFP